jgi:hypothetical protein
MIVMVVLQLVLPIHGLYVAQTTGEVARFSWYMFSRLGDDAQQPPESSPR